MAIIAEQYASSFTTNGSSVLSLSSPVTAGSLLVVCSYAYNDSSMEVWQTNAVWNKIFDYLPPAGGRVELWYAYNVSASASQDVSLIYESSPEAASIVQEFTGAILSDPFIGYNFGNTLSGANSPIEPITTGLGDLVVVSFGLNIASVLSINSGGFDITHQVQTNNGYGTLGFFKKIANSASTSGSVDHDSGGSGHIIANFAAAPIDINMSDAITVSDLLYVYPYKFNIDDAISILDLSHVESQYNRYVSDSILLFDGSVTNSSVFSFKTISNSTISPTYSEILNLVGPSTPSGWSAVFAGTGSTPTFNGGMIPNPGSAGTSYIEKSSYGLDINNGILIDLDIIANTTNGDAVANRQPILQIFKGGYGRISINFDWTQDPEISIGGVGTIVTGAAIPLPIDTVLNFKLRISIKGTSYNDLLIKLYVGFENGTNRTMTACVLQQTLTGPASFIGTTEDRIRVGSYIAGDIFVTYNSISILNGAGPDQYYVSPIVASQSINEGLVSGGDKLLIIGDNLSAEIITPNLDDFTWISDVSQGTGSSISIVSNKLQLEIDSATASINDASIAKLSIPLNSNSLGGIDIQFDLEADNNLLTTLPGFDVISFGAEIKINDSSFAIELLNNISNRTAKFYVINRTGNSVVRGVAGIEISRREILNVTTPNHNIRFVNVGGNLTLFVNGQEIESQGFSNFPMLLTLYAKVAQPKDVSTIIKNFVVKPILLFGDKMADIINADDILLNAYVPQNTNIGQQNITLRGPLATTSLGNFTYLQEPQETSIGENQNIDLFVIDPIIKKPVE